ncbi:energy-coupling factor transporter transmembrane component T family protein [Paenibacillus humicola]|uniref:energy-coupling factor transporter transmembrane component T family protein n=1 Tax=Paenibacillus humicola TaxID=3110540 RepID=UPI00237B9045|nr:energy-coupling factor transporter transmembrane component T [Paenibacillus humicola]
MASGYSIYIERPSVVHQALDPRTKTVAVLAIFVLSLCFNHPLPLALVAALLIGTALWIRLPVTLIRMLLLSGVWFVLLSLIVWPAYVKTGEPLFNVMGVALTDTGLWFGLAMGLRVTIMVLSAGIWMATTSPQKMTAAFLKLGLPYKAAMSVSFAIRLVPLVGAEWVTVVEAQKSRGYDYKSGNPLARIRKSVMILGPMLLRSIDIAQSLAIALEARAFGARKNRTCITEVQLKSFDYIVMLAALGAIVLGICCRLTGTGVLLADYL